MNEVVHKLSPVSSDWDKSTGLLFPAPTSYRVSCQCGEEFEADTDTEVVALATEHVSPGMGDFARDLYSGN